MRTSHFRAPDFHSGRPAPRAPDRLVVVFLLLSALSSLGSAPIDQTEFLPGEATSFAWANLGQDPVLFLPENYAERESCPVLFYYHGTNGSPTVKWMRQLTDDRDWILVGMTYREQGRFENSPQNLAREIAVYKALRASLRQRLKVDDQRVYVGGFSKGGWLSGLFLEEDASLAGGLILGAGSLSDTLEKGRHARKRVLIGIGESDPNLAMATRAQRVFLGADAAAMLDIWPDTSHAIPALEKTETIGQWLAISAGEATPAKAVRWFDRQLSGIHKDESLSAAERVDQLVTLAAAPFAAFVDEESRAAHTAQLVAAKALPEWNDVAETEAKGRYLNILNKESRDRQVGTLIDCHIAYEKLAKEAPSTIFGRKAAVAAERTRWILE